MVKTLRERGHSAQEEATGSVQQVIKRRRPGCKATKGRIGKTVQFNNLTNSTGKDKITVRKCRPQDESTLGGRNLLQNPLSPG